jgi:hypothetical protein
VLPLIQTNSRVRLLVLALYLAWALVFFIILLLRLPVIGNIFVTFVSFTVIFSIWHQFIDRSSFHYLQRHTETFFGNGRLKMLRGFWMLAVLCGFGVLFISLYPEGYLNYSGWVCSIGVWLLFLGATFDVTVLEIAAEER